MNERVYAFLGQMYDDATWPNSDPKTCVKACWDNQGDVVGDLYDAYLELTEAEDNDEVYQRLTDKSFEHFEVMALLIRDHFHITKRLFSKGMAVADNAVSFLLSRYDEGDNDLKVNVTIMLSKLGELAANASSKLTAALLRDSADESSRMLRRAAAFALGKIGGASDEVVGVLSNVAQDVSESQALRAMCIEALMDLGPEASSSSETLENIFKNDEDEDLRQFAWAALKSVTAVSKEHPCGGTVAEHMRSLRQIE